eukprot:GHRR01024063.1.p1 GENE.GHRR01024063.1~~GHRR01024063.1.p1  ORF type:complete len:100 (+),score=16.63 GHRR01024063.1:260-559(+)
MKVCNSFWLSMHLTAPVVRLNASVCKCCTVICAFTLQKDLLPVCRELGIGVLAYSPLGRGMLTGQIKDVSQLDPSDFRVTSAPWFQGENLQKVRDIAEV